jgi:HK97 family phage major capsid protein
VLIPFNAPLNYRALSTSTGAGAIVLDTAPTLIDMLRARMVLGQLGVRFLTDYTQPFKLPKLTTSPTATVVATEGTAVSEVDPEIGNITYNYHSIETRFTLTRQYLKGTSLTTDAYLADEIVRVIGQKIQNDVLNGAGYSGAVKGLFKHTNGTDGIQVKALGTAGANATWNDMVAFAALADTANASDENRAYLFNPTTVAYLQSTPKVSGQARFILDSDGLIAGYPYASTSAVPNNLTKSTGTGLSAMAFGSWSDMQIALFGGIDVMADTMSAQPHIKMLGVVDYDMHLAHPESWAICTDLDTDPS